MTIRPYTVHTGKYLSHFAGVFDPDINSAGEMLSCGIATISQTSVTRRRYNAPAVAVPAAL